MEKLFIVLDISNESIGGNLCVQSFRHEVTILYSIRLPIIWEEPATTKPLLIKIRQTLSLVIKNIHDKGIPEARKQGILRSNIAQVFVTYASPWYLSQTKGLVSEYAKPLLITKKLLHELIETEEKEFITALKDHTHSELYNNVKVIERRIVDIKLNGYSTQAPYHKKAQKIELNIHASFVSRDILLITTDSIAHYFHCEVIKYFSFPLVTFTAISHLHPELTEYLIVDVRGETTDISLVKNKALWETVSFPQGSGAVFREISEKTNTSIHIADSILHMHEQGKNTPEVSLAVDPILAAIGKKWMAMYQSLSKEITQAVGMPKKVFLIVDRIVEKHFIDNIKNTQPHTVVTVLKGYHLKDAVASTVKHTDTPLALETYLAKLSL